MPRLERLSEIQRKSLLGHPCIDNETAPFTPLARPLAATRLALVTTASIHLRGDALFTAGDRSFRAIPADALAADVIQSHTSIAFDRSAFQRDRNVVFPVDRLRELVASGEVGGLGPTFYALLGAQYPPYDGLVESGREIGRRLRADGVEAVFLTGT